MRCVRKNDEARMPNGEGNPNEETRKDPKAVVPVFATRASSLIRHSHFVIFLGFPLVNQNVFSQLWHRLWYVIKIIVCFAWCHDVHETCNSIVLRRVFVCPSKNRPVRPGPPQPGIKDYHGDQILWRSAFDLANHLLLHLLRVLLRFHQAVSVNISGRRMSV